MHQEITKGFTIQEMTIRDYNEILALWQNCEGIGLSDADSREGIESFLAHNPGLAFVAREGASHRGEPVGAVLCGTDGRRGYIHHLAVSQSHRHQGLGRALVDLCLNTLHRIGIQKCHIFVYRDNADAIAFWNIIGWTQRVELTIMSRSIGKYLPTRMK